MAPPTPRPQSSSYPKFDAANAGLSLSTTAAEQNQNEGDSGADIPRRNSSDPSSSSSTSTSSSSTSKKDDNSSMQNLRGIFLSKEEREKQGLGKKAGGAKKSASVPGPLKSAMKPGSNTAAMGFIPNSDPLPVDREALTGRLNHTRSQLQKLADRAERINEWIDMDVIVLTRLTNELKAASETTSSQGPSIRLTEAGSSSSSPVDTTSVTDDIMHLNKRIESMNRFRKDLEQAVYWNREEFRRIEKALGRTKSAQSGAVLPPARNVGFNDQEKPQKQGKLGIAGDEVDNEKNRNTLAELEAKLQAGMSLEEAADAQTPLREQDYARDRWTSSFSRLPNQTEWEELVGPKTIQKK